MGDSYNYEQRSTPSYYDSHSGSSYPPQASTTAQQPSPVAYTSYAQQGYSAPQGKTMPGFTVSPSASTTRDSQAGPQRSTPSQQHKRQFSATTGNNAVASGSGTGRVQNPGPYSRPAEQPRPDDGLQQTSVKASSTTSEFTKRKNWSQHIIDEIQDFMHVLTPEGNFMFCSPSVRDLTGWQTEELMGRPITDYIHTDDVDGFKRDFASSIENGSSMNLYYRFRMTDERYTIFEVGGHPYYVNESGGKSVDTTDAEKRGECKCFFAMARPYPSKNTAMLDSFLELKMENERLRQDLQLMYKEIEGGGGLQGQYGFDRDRRPSLANPYGNDSSMGVIDPTTGLVQANGLLPSSSNTYGALGIGISATGTKGDGTGDKKKKKTRPEEGEFVCRDCGTVDSPEWRKGPDGPKSLCNACGLRYAKLRSKDKLKQQQAQASASGDAK